MHHTRTTTTHYHLSMPYTAPLNLTRHEHLIPTLVQGNDIYELSSTLACTAGCSDAGYFMPTGACTTPVAADCYGCNSTCNSYCESWTSDCSVCPSDTYYEGFSTNTECTTW